MIGTISSFATLFLVVAKCVLGFRIPTYVYLFVRYFGASVIVTTAFIHLLDPVYGEIGPDICVGLTSGWSEYSWPPAIVLASVMGIFVMDFVAERYVETKYGIDAEQDIQEAVTRNRDMTTNRTSSGPINRSRSLADGTHDEHNLRGHGGAIIEAQAEKNYAKKFMEASNNTNSEQEEEARRFVLRTGQVVGNTSFLRRSNLSVFKLPNVLFSLCLGRHSFQRMTASSLQGSHSPAISDDGRTGVFSA